MNLKFYFIDHLRNCINCLGSMWRAKTATLLTILVISIALALPTGFLLLIKNINLLNKNFNDNIEMSVFVKSSLSENNVNTLAKQISSEHLEILSYRIILKKEALTELMQANNQSELLNFIDDNPLPHTIIFELDQNIAETKADEIINNIATIPNVDSAQLDLEWLKKLIAVTSLAKKFTYVLAGFLSIAVLLIIGNTTYLTVENNKQTIIVERIVGATDGFIKREFIYFGLCHGLIASMMAWIIINTLFSMINPHISYLASLYGNAFNLKLLNFSSGCNLIIFGSTLGILGAWFSVNNYIKNLRFD